MQLFCRICKNSTLRTWLLKTTQNILNTKYENLSPVEYVLNKKNYLGKALPSEEEVRKKWREYNSSVYDMWHIVFVGSLVFGLIVKLMSFGS